MRSPIFVALLAGMLSTLGCATLFGRKPSEHPVWSQPVVAETPVPARPAPELATVTLKLKSEMTLASLRGIAIKVDGRLVRRQLITASAPPGTGYETSLGLDGQTHEICVLAWFDGIDVLKNKEMLVTSERLVDARRDLGVQMHVHMDPAPDRTWAQMVQADWTGGMPTALRPENCGVDRKVLTSPMESGGIVHGSGIVHPSSIGRDMLPPPPPPW